MTRKYGDAARRLAMVFCHEVHTYLSTVDSPRRKAVRATVAETIAEARPRVVVAHSLGSVDIIAVPRGGLGRAFAGVEDTPDLTIGEFAFHGVEAYLRRPESAPSAVRTAPPAAI